MWIATADQVRITNTALQLAREEFNATHRPKLRVRHMKPDLSAGTQVRGRYVIVNVGETTATIKRHDITLSIKPADSGAKQALQSSPLERPQLEGGESRPFFTNIDTQFDFGWGMPTASLKSEASSNMRMGLGPRGAQNSCGPTTINLDASAQVMTKRKNTRIRKRRAPI